jgi:PAS domain S-box-containing protein
MSSPLSNTTDSKEFVKNFTKFASSISEGVIISDEKEEIIWVNKSFEKISGYTLKELIGKGPEIFHGVNTNKRVVQNLRKTIKKGEPVSIELINYKPDGTPYWINLSITPILNENNKVTKYISLERDITEQKLIEKNKEQSEEIYKILFKKSPVNMFIFDPVTYRIIEANETALGTYGYTKEEFSKLTIKDIRPPEDWKKVKKIIKEINEEFVVKGVWKHMKKNGDIIFVDVKARAIEYNGKKAILTIPVDVTDRYVKEQEIKDLNNNLTSLNFSLKENLGRNNELLHELKIKEQKISTARQSAKIGMWEIDIKTKKITTSEEIYNIFNFKPGEKLTFKKFQNRIHKDDLDKYTKSIDNLVINSEPIDIEYKLKPIDGKCKHIVSKGAVIYDDNGHPELYSGITIDITDKKLNEIKIAEQLKNINIILSGITTPFFIVDKKYNLLFMNDTSARLSGFAKEELVGRNIFEVYPDRDFIEEKKEYDKAIKENKSRRFETTYSGRTFTVNLYPSDIGLAVSAIEITENKKITKELEEKAKFIEEIGNNTPGGIIQTVYHPDGRVEAAYISAGFKELWGLNPEDVKKDVGERFTPIHPEDRESVKTDIDNAIKNLIPLDHKFRFINQRTNELRWVHAKAVPSKKEDGSVVLNGVFLDITESEKYYTELEKSNLRYEFISKAAHEGIWDWDIATNIVSLGGNYSEIMKNPVDLKEITFEQFVSVIHPDDLDRVLKKFNEVISDKTKRVWEDTFRIFNNLGEIVYVQEKGYGVYDEKEDKIIRFVGSTHDITQEVLDREALKEKAAFIEEIGDNIPGALFKETVYPDGSLKIYFLSEGFEKFWGVPVKHVINNPNEKIKFIHPDDIEKVRETISKISGKAKVTDKLRYINQKTGEIFWISINADANKNEDGSVTLTGVAIDVSDTEKFYNELEKSNRRYEYVSKAANEVIWDWDLKTNIMELAGNYEVMFGYQFPDKKVPFEFVESRIHPDDLEIVKKNIQFGMTDIENHHRDNYYRMLDINDNVIYIYERSYTIFDPVTNEPLKIIGTTQDITLRKKHEEEIKQKAKFIQHLSNNIPGAIFQSVYYPDGTSKLTFASEGFKELWGMEVDDVIKNSDKRFIPVHTEDIERIKSEVKECLKNLSPLDCKYRFVNQETGKISWVRSKSMPEKMKDGSIVLTGVIIDVTDTENYYTELEKSNKRYEYVSKAANEAIWDLDLIKQEFTFGGSYQEMFGYSLPENKSGYEPIMSMIHPDDTERVLKSVEDVLKDKSKRYWECYYRVIRKDGITVYVYDRGYVIYDEKDNVPVRFVGATQNITQRKKDEEAIKAEIRRNNIIVESMTDPFFVIGKDLKVILANQAGLNLSKNNKETLFGKDLYSFDFVKNHSDLFDLFKETMDKNEAFHGEFKIGLRWFDVLLYPSEIGLAVHARDITKRKNQQEELEKNSKFIKEISDSTPGFSFQLEFNTNLVPKLNFASDKAGDYWGIPVSEAVSGKAELFQSVHKDDINNFRKSMLDSITNLTHLNFKYRLVNKITGDIRWVRAAAIPTRLENGNTLVNGAVIDITDAETYYTKLEQANQRYEHVSKATNNAIWELDLKKGVCIIGGAYEEMFGYNLPDNILTDEFHEKLLHPDDLEDVNRSKKEALKDKTNRYWERSYRIVRKDGEVRFVNDRAYIVYDEENETPVKIIGSTQDITENIEHEEALKKNAKFIKEISESMHGFIFQTEYDENYNAKLNYASKNAYDYWGVTPEEVIVDPSKLLGSIHFEDIAEVVNKRIDSAKNLTNMNFKFRYVNKTTGEIKWVRAMAVPTRLENGHTLVNGTIVDITDTENYYNKLEEATRRYEYLSKATHETIWEMDVANREILLGGGYKEMLGQEFPENKIPFALWEKRVHPEDLERTVSSMHLVLADPNKRYWESKYRIIREDGKVIDVFERAYIVYDEKNSVPVKIIGSTQDVTELNKVQAERDNMVTDLVKRNKALEQFTYMVSHNLRAPIANILGISYLLDEGEHDEATLGEMHQLIKQSSSNLDNVIRDMNEILSVKKGFNEERTKVILDDLLNDIIETESTAIHESKVAIISDFKEVESLVTVKNYMHSIFQNLISNGIKYRSTESPWIKISSNEDENYIYLNFEDNGIGIDLEKNKNKIFGLYNKFHLNKEGKGMGLFMVKSHVESLDGEISVVSEVNKGTKFIIKLKK